VTGRNGPLRAAIGRGHVARWHASAGTTA